MNRRHFVKGNGDMDYIAYTSYLESKKQSLKKYLEDKIENERKIQKFLYENKNTKLVEKATTNSVIRTCQEILDKIRSDIDE